jgi:hypothetical protein
MKDDWARFSLDYSPDIRECLLTFENVNIAVSMIHEGAVHSMAVQRDYLVLERVLHLRSHVRGNKAPEI